MFFENFFEGFNILVKLIILLIDWQIKLHSNTAIKYFESIPSVLISGIIVSSSVTLYFSFFLTLLRE